MYGMHTRCGAVSQDFGGPAQTLGDHRQPEHDGILTLLHYCLLSGLGRPCVNLTWQRLSIHYLKLFQKNIYFVHHRRSMSTCCVLISESAAWISSMAVPRVPRNKATAVDRVLASGMFQVT